MWGRASRNKQIERMMWDEEVYNSKDLNEERARRRKYMVIAEYKFKKYQEDIQRRGICPHCYVVQTAMGTCTYNCSGSRKAAQGKGVTV